MLCISSPTSYLWHTFLGKCWSTPSQNYCPPKTGNSHNKQTTYNSHTDPLFRSPQIIIRPKSPRAINLLYLCLTMYKIIFLSRLTTFSLSIVTSKPSVKHANLIYCMYYVSRCTSSFASKLPLHTLPKLWHQQWADCAPLSRYQFKQHLKSSTILCNQAQV